MKKVLEKFLIATILVVMLSNSILICPTYAANNDDAKEEFEDGLVGLLGGLVGILTLPERLTAIMAANSMNELTAVIAYVDNSAEQKNNDKDKYKFITPFNILFNDVTILDVNFFNISSPTEEEGGVLVNKVRKSVAGWYYAMRNIAASILLCILGYVGIRMAISTIASDRAMYKKMLVDWVCSLVLIFVLQYIMVFTVYANNAIVGAMREVSKDVDFSGVFTDIKKIADDVFNVNALAATIVYCMLVWQTLGLFIAYFNRMIKVAFLVIISPLISVTYSIDKIGDGKAQALNNWLKEFVFTILIQPFHCAIYMSLVHTSVKILTGSSQGDEYLPAALITILCIKFIKEGEKIVRKIFSFADDNKGTSLAAGMMASSMLLSKSRSLGHTAKEFGKGAINFGKNIPKGIRNIGIETVAAAKYLSSRNEDKSFADTKADVQASYDNWKADRINASTNRQLRKQEKFRSTELGKKLSALRSANKTAGVKLNDRAYQEKRLRDKTEEKLRASNGTMTYAQAEAAARLDLAKQDRIDASGVTGTAKRKISSIKKKWDNGPTSTARVLKEIAKQKAATGVGLMVGSGVLGTNANLATAITSGAAIKGAVGEFLASEEKDIMFDSKGYANAAGINSIGDLSNLMDEMRNNPDKFTPGTSKALEELDKLSKFLDQLENQGLAPNIKSRIRNEIEADPKNAPEAVGNILAAASNDVEPDKLGQYKKDSDALLQYVNQCALYQSYKEAQDKGISDASFEQDVAGSLDSNEAVYGHATFGNMDNDEKIIQQSINNGDIPPGKEEERYAALQANRDKTVEDLKTQKLHDIEELDAAYEVQIAAEQELLETLQYSGVKQDVLTAIEERIKILDQTRNEVISRAIIERDQSLSSISVSLAERYRESIQAEIERLRKELDDGKTLAENELVRLKNLQEVDLKKLTHSPSDYKMKKEMYENT